MQIYADEGRVIFLQLPSDRKEHSLKETYDRLADHLELTPEERTELLPSGRQETYKNRIG